MAAQNSNIDPWDEFLQNVQTELDHSKRAYKEVALMLEQSQAELNKLTQRNSNITAHLQLVQSQIETIPRADIRMAYNSALDAQQRLLVMRNQIEKLQTDQNSLQRFIAFLEQTREFLTEGHEPSKSTRAARGGSATLEKLVNAQEAERKRLSRQMHDGPAQALSNFIVQAEIASRLFDVDPVRAKEELENLKTAAMATFQNVRLFVTGLRPMMLDDLGLVPTLKRYVDGFKDESGIEAKINIKGTEQRLEPYLEVMVFRAVQELMSNAVRHNIDAPTKPQINVQMALEDNMVRVLVHDNGKGFDPEDVQNESGLGLKLIRERVEMLGGYMEVESAPGQDTRVTFQIPIEYSIES
jgi:two-component system, NarL family, sensor histidine kinase DegS